MLHRLQQSANLRIPSVDQAPELDVPLFEVLGVAFEDLQVLVPVKVVPLPASSVASATSVFRQGLNLLGKRLIFCRVSTSSAWNRAASTIVNVSCKDSMLRYHAKPLSRRASGDVFCWNALEPNNESQEMQIVTKERDNSTNWTTAKSTNINLCELSGARGLTFLQPHPLLTAQGSLYPPQVS